MCLKSISQCNNVKESNVLRHNYYCRLSSEVTVYLKWILNHLYIDVLHFIKVMACQNVG